MENKEAKRSKEGIPLFQHSSLELSFTNPTIFLTFNLPILIRENPWFQFFTFIRTFIPPFNQLIFQEVVSPDLRKL